jgi:hypothetical protein
MAKPAARLLHGFEARMFRVGMADERMKGKNAHEENAMAANSGAIAGTRKPPLDFVIASAEVAGQVSESKA